MNKSFFRFSFCLLLVSLVNMCVLAFGPGWFSMPILILMQLAVLATSLTGMMRSRRGYKPWASPGHFFKGTPNWLLLSGVLTAVLLVVCLPSTTSVFQSMSDRGASSMQWFERAGRYFIELDKKDVQEISQAQFDSLNIQLHRFFAAGWTIFAYLSLCMWERLQRLQQ